MAWRSSGSSHSELIDNLRDAGIIKTERVYEAMLAVDRANFCATDAYIDAPQSLGHKATISAPHMHAYALEFLGPFLKAGANVLDVGSGSGYLCAVFAHLVEPNGSVHGVEHIPELVEMSRQNLAKCGPPNLNIELHLGDGRMGLAGFAPYDVIHVGAAAQSIPEALIHQLKDNGIMFIPVGFANEAQKIMLVTKRAGSVEKRSIMAVSYVPLTDAPALPTDCH